MKVWAAICGGKVGNVGNGLGGCAGCGGGGKLTGICGAKGTVAAGGRAVAKGEGLAVGLG